VLHGVTELLSNVHRHVPDDRRCVLELTMADAAVYVTVEDHCANAPAVSVPDWTSERGRGLWMLREMAEGFGYVPTAGGKRVWIRVRASGAVRRG
jgi:serine/threonine-protein kinase RsbW